MKQYKLTYDVHLKNSSGGFCTTPLEIMSQMDDARAKTLKLLRDFLKREGLEAQVGAITSPAGIGINIYATEEVAAKLKNAPFLSGIEEVKAKPQPPKPRF